MTKSVAVVNAQHNIRVNSISPLAVNTPTPSILAAEGITYKQAAASFVTPRIDTRWRAPSFWLLMRRRA